jgi:VIT1/CCC1 family predicted Fe2+/Mn2+ transporter
MGADDEDSGGLLPMIPFFAMRRVKFALFVSIGIAGMLRMAFGYAKQIVAGSSRRLAALHGLQTLVLGAATAAASYGIVRGVSSLPL